MAGGMSIWRKALAHIIMEETMEESKITADVAVEFQMSFKQRLVLIWACLRGGRFRLVLPDSTVNLNKGH